MPNFRFSLYPCTIKMFIIIPKTTPTIGIIKLAQPNDKTFNKLIKCNCFAIKELTPITQVAITPTRAPTAPRTYLSNTLFLAPSTTSYLIFFAKNVTLRNGA